MNAQWIETAKMVNTSVFENYHELVNTIVPEYTLNLGKYSCPSKLFFCTKPLWDKMNENQRVPVSVLSKQLIDNLHQELCRKYGNAVPDRSTAHFSVHSTVAGVIEDNYTNAETMTDEMIVDCLVEPSRTDGKKGNIYGDTVFPAVVLAIQDYLRFRKAAKTDVVNEQFSTEICSHKKQSSKGIDSKWNGI